VSPTPTLLEVPAPRRATRGLPVLGQVLDYVRDPMALFEQQWTTYGAVSPLHLLGRDPWLMLLGPDAQEAVLTNRDKAFANGPAWSYLVGPFFHGGLMLLDFEEHHVHRRVLQQAFTRDRLAGYTARVHPAVERGLASWRPRPGFPAYPALKTLTLDIAAEIFMGGAEQHSPAEMARVNRAFIDCVQAATALVRVPLPPNRWWRAHRGRRLLEDFIRSYLPQRRATESSDLLSRLCHLRDEDGTGLTDEQVVDHMVFLMMAAHDTSTSTLSTMMEMLGKHPEWQQRCREESLALGDAPTLDELDGLVSLDLVMRECLRLRSPVPVVVRRTVKDTEVLGTRIPADHYVSIAPQFTHLMPELWTDPRRFDPERFGPDRREDKRHRHAWDPFGGGVHKCLGMAFAGAEVTAVLHHLLRRFAWEVDPGYTAPLDHHSLPFPSDGQPVDLHPLETP
jgi:cytochrome P450